MLLDRSFPLGLPGWLECCERTPFQILFARQAAQRCRGRLGATVNLGSTLHTGELGHVIERCGDPADQDAAVLICPVDLDVVVAVEAEHEDRIPGVVGRHRDARHAVEIDPTLLTVDARDLQKTTEHVEAPFQSPSAKSAAGLSAGTLPVREAFPLLLARGRGGIELAPHSIDQNRLRHRPANPPPDLSARLRIHRAAGTGCW